MLFTYLVVVFSFLSVFGWVWETIVFSLQEKHFVRRGFLAGPYCPIYGVGALMILALAIWIHQLVYLVIAAMVVATLLEYSTSVLLEKWFKLKLWDYKREKYNYQGRICLKTTIIWGFFALLFVYVLNPISKALAVSIYETYNIYLAIVLIAIFVVDTIYSVTHLSQLHPPIHGKKLKLT